ncbi:MAG: hypothetical protein AAFN92_20455, partial [Bacteroidota bacterium]
VQVGGDDIIRYTMLNFVGIQFTAPTIDVSAMDRFHLDIWTPDPIAAGSEFKVLLVDLGPDNAFGGDNDASHEIVITPPQLEGNSWVSIDLPLTDFPGLTTRANLAQVVLSGNVPNVFMDNLYFYQGAGDDGGVPQEPTTAAPTPTRAANGVISLFSDAYTDVPVDTWRTDWSNAEFEDVMIDGNATKKYSALDFVGIETTSSPLDVSSMTHVHLDVWSPNFTQFGIKLVDAGADGMIAADGDDVEQQLDFPSLTRGEWVSLDIPMSDFEMLTTRGNLAQYILVGQPSEATTIYVDNFYFYDENADGGGGTEPTMAAPTPTRAAGDVISLFSDAYTDVPVDTWRTDWSSATFEDVMVDGNATKKYSELDFVGIETTANTVDASGMTHIHLDVWSADFTQFGIKLVDAGADWM